MDRPKSRDDIAPVDDAQTNADEEREALSEDTSVQDYRSENEPAESRTTFGDDSVTPRLNDGR